MAKTLVLWCFGLIGAEWAAWECFVCSIIRISIKPIIKNICVNNCKISNKMASHEHLHVPHICYQSSINCNFETSSNSFVLAKVHSVKSYLASP